MGRFYFPRLSVALVSTSLVSTTLDCLGQVQIFFIQGGGGGRCEVAAIKMFLFCLPPKHFFSSRAGRDGPFLLLPWIVSARFEIFHSSSRWCVCLRLDHFFSVTSETQLLLSLVTVLVYLGPSRDFPCNKAAADVAVIKMFFQIFFIQGVVCAISIFQT